MCYLQSALKFRRRSILQQVAGYSSGLLLPSESCEGIYKSGVLQLKNFCWRRANAATSMARAKAAKRMLCVVTVDKGGSEPKEIDEITRDNRDASS